MKNKVIRLIMKCLVPGPHKSQLCLQYSRPLKYKVNSSDREVSETRLKLLLEVYSVLNKFFFYAFKKGIERNCLNNIHYPSNIIRQVEKHGWYFNPIPTSALYWGPNFTVFWQYAVMQSYCVVKSANYRTKPAQCIIC